MHAANAQIESYILNDSKYPLRLFNADDAILSRNGVDIGAIFVIIYRHSEAERRYLKYAILTHHTPDRTHTVRRILNPLV